VAEINGLLNRRTGLNLYRGFESLPHRFYHPDSLFIPKFSIFWAIISDRKYKMVTPNDVKSDPGIFKKNKIEIISSGSQYFKTLESSIEHATESIFLQFYIIDYDYTAKRIIDLLKLASSRGVKVFILADGYASKNFPTTIISELRNSGIEFEFFAPLWQSKNYYFGRRLHHKIALLDQKKAILGGLNMSDRYNDLNGQPGWLDFAIALEGPTAKDICQWASSYTKSKQDLRFQCRKDHIPNSPGGSLCRIRRNDWVIGKTEISTMYHRMLAKAENKVILLSSYFLPGATLRKLLKKAALRGVEIYIIAAGPSDVPIAKYAEQWLYDWLLRLNIKLFEYRPNVLHGKLALIDDQWFTVGSYNINDLSAKASIEANLEIRDSVQGKILSQKLHEIMDTHCVPINESFHKKSSSLFMSFVRRISYDLLRWVLYLTTFYYRRQKRKKSNV
jgi:cardiolipin synthase A/B